jgi:hypothetical protein
LVPLPEAANAAVATPTTSAAEMAETAVSLRANMRSPPIPFGRVGNLESCALEAPPRLHNRH